MEHNPGGAGVERVNSAIYGLGKHQALEIQTVEIPGRLILTLQLLDQSVSGHFHEPPLVADAPAPCPRDRCV